MDGGGAMAQIGAAAVCVVIAGVVAVGYIKGLPVFDLFIEGAAQGLKTAVKLLPTLVGLIAAISMLRASGVLELLTGALRPLTEWIGLDPEIVPLALLRPFSGSGSVSYVTSLYSRFGADSETARLAAILASSTETTFYAAAVYFGGRGLRSTRYTIPAALCGDCMAVVLSVVSIRLFG